MSSSQVELWSYNPNAPRIPYTLYFAEKANFAGILIGAISYGIVIILFFLCMSALLSPMNRTQRKVRWILVIHTVTMFMIVTVYTALNLDLQSISYIDNRDFPGDRMSPPGPLGYQWSVYSEAITFVPNLLFIVNTWLSDGLLLYRCYIIYAKNYWAVLFPCLVYLASVAMGSVLIYYEVTQPDDSTWDTTALNFNYPYFMIALSLNVLLTLIIVTRLLLHSREIRNATGVKTPTITFCATVLVESSALYAISFALFVGPWAAKSDVSEIFFPILAETQVIAPFLIVLRVAKQSALTSDSTSPGYPGSIHFRSGESVGSVEEQPHMRFARPVDIYGKSPDELGFVVSSRIIRHDMV